MTYLENPMKQYTGLLTLGDFTLAPGTVYTEHFHQNYIEANGRGYILVVPDEAAKGLAVHHKAYARNRCSKGSDPDQSQGCMPCRM